jgi:hypothetical protein
MENILLQLDVEALFEEKKYRIDIFCFKNYQFIL